MKTILTAGTFDLLHVGHLELFEMCREIAGPDGLVIVGVNPDDFVERFKGRRPVIPYLQRAEMVRACRDVDLVMENDGEEDAKPLILRAMPDIIAIGEDWAPPRDYLGQLGVTQEWLDVHGIEVRYLPRTRGTSSSAIRARLA